MPLPPTPPSLSAFPSPSAPHTHPLPQLDRVGSVPYLNVAPLVAGLENSLRWLPPSQLARALRDGELDVGLVSLTAVLHDPDYDILDGPCIASDGTVFSVFLAHRGPRSEIRQVFCHDASLTSINLLRVLLAEEGLHPDFLPLPDPTQAHPHPAVLLIGNPAITFRLAGSDHTIWDLGEAWKQRTGLPFVYAVWALRRAADTTALRAVLQQAARRGLADREAVIRRTTEFTESFRRTYLTQHIQFHLGPREKEGITRFAALMDRHGLGPIFPPRYIA